MKPPSQSGVPVAPWNGAVTDEWGRASNKRYFMRLRPVAMAQTSPAEADFDGDGLRDLAEIRAGTQPFNPDSDDDGMPDGWEFDHLLNPLWAEDARLHWDEDDMDNLCEYHTRTDPAADDTEALEGEEEGDFLQAPTNIGVHAVAPGQQRITWISSDPRATKLLLLRTDNGRTWTTLAVLPGGRSAFTDKEAVEAVAYFYSLIAVE